MNTLSSLLSFIGSFEPIGSVKMYAGSSAPNKWLICDGSAVSRDTFAKLYAVIGTTYGAGDGSTTFNLPDFRGRTAIGVGTGTASGATAHALAQMEGAETITLSISQMPKHTHVQNPHNHTQNAHTHQMRVRHLDSGSNAGYGLVNSANTTATGGTQYTINGNVTNLASTYGASVLNATATNIQATATNQETGGNGAHSNMQPYLAVNYIIFAGK